MQYLVVITISEPNTPVQPWGWSAPYPANQVREHRKVLESHHEPPCIITNRIVLVNYGSSMNSSLDNFYLL
ncbi:hypothetical protein TNCV_869101 [Trichonephila clavipes]|nr:hypothetical protein TNCV_869101 [Trichonephila clavipes]